MSREINEVEIEINKFLDRLNIDKLPNLSKTDFKTLAKITLFFKELVDGDRKTYYSSFMIYDMIMVIYLLTLNSEREIYNTYRSLIENFIRYELQLSDNDDTGVYKLFKLFKDKFKQFNATKILDVIDSEYNKCCQYVHSNIKAQIKLESYLDDIIKHQHISDERRKCIINEVINFYKNMVTLSCYINNNNINRIFYRNNQKLKLLIEDDNYDIIRKKL